ncbi:GNAT family N-acetyltransferase [Cellulomonas fimi]|uniref:FR47 domain protein n=1 Tax=Cellulomonas fimi (strain ATCC 484 / DSM 20113 / JCM 1341 / CCUG 24087 / LMG 16345 / NBRC 15513 / NCIMB 8980 / NCTC 7547 / NRS-133) TaxID=590998 RepID=F4GYF9_CELFA|nr:GNAT family N-acetyltransferase [Cellulomonas fimi]AEE45948.1 FR47 domain protein [Cellulomonas fimi ATCC 484]NNH06534.1 GNAT family N-acetyltransferase [Cellulomonas fimi]VEH31086.1 Predicted acetyltransferase [Cellulomonas fimi]
MGAETVQGVREDVRDNAAWHSLQGAHAALGEGNELARRYLPDVSPFAAVRSWSDPDVWDAVLDLVGPGATFPVSGDEPVLPAGWTLEWRAQGVQLVETDRLTPRPDDEAVVLGPGDVPEMLALVGRTQPGPFLPRTHELGRYVGLRRAGRLVAMAGERLQPAGWTEISAVCTDDAHRGQGLATRLVLDVAHHAQARGDRVLLHAAATNTGAVRLYEALGFTLRRTTTFAALRTPDRR